MKILEADGGALLTKTSRGSGRVNLDGGPLAGAVITSVPTRDGTISRPFHAVRAKNGVPMEVIFVYRLNAEYGVVFRTLSMEIQSGKAKVGSLLADALEESGVKFRYAAVGVLGGSTMFAHEVAGITASEYAARAWLVRGLMKNKTFLPDPLAQAAMNKVVTDLLLNAHEPASRVKPHAERVEAEADALLEELDDLAGFGLDFD